MNKTEYIKKLQHREREISERIAKMKASMNETRELSTLEHISKLLKEAKDELGIVQKKLNNSK
ncbi:hypothetical protein ACFLRM_05875 [Acidobacteriota bacterium]